MNYLDILIPFVGDLECSSMACRSWLRDLRMQPEQDESLFLEILTKAN